MTECQNCGASNASDNYYCDSCGYPIQGSFEERAKFSLGGDTWKNKDIDEQEQPLRTSGYEGDLSRRIRIAQWTTLGGAIFYGLVTWWMFAFSRTTYTEWWDNVGVRAELSDIAYVCLGLGAFQFVLFSLTFLKKFKVYLILSLVIQCASLVSGIIMINTINVHPNVISVVIWILLQALIIISLGLGVDAATKLEAIERQDELDVV